MKDQRLSKKIASFWLKPLLVGSCLAAGYEITHRIMIMKSTESESKIELFKNQRPFQEKRLKSFNARKTESSYISNFAERHETKMQTLLNALETNWKDNERPKENNPKKGLHEAKEPVPFRSSIKPTLIRQLFDELLKTLPEP